MSKSKIEWTDETWNPVTGCAKVSQGCKHCYAERTWDRLSANPKTVYFGREFTDVRCHAERLDQPLRWTKPRRIFVNSMSDLFHEDVPALFIADVFAVMAAAKHHTFQVLTKRPDALLYLLSEERTLNFKMAVEEALALYTDEPLIWPIPNVWIGVSVEDQSTADERIPLLLQTPAAVRWISVEPLLGPINLEKSCALYRWIDPDGVECSAMPRHIGWVVVGGESGAKARPMHPDWIRRLRDRCAAAGVPFLFKQWGEWAPSKTLPPDTLLPYRRWGWISIKGGTVDGMHDKPFNDEFSHHELMGKIGKKAAGRLLDGVLHDGYPS